MTERVMPQKLWDFLTFTLSSLSSGLSMVQMHTLVAMVDNLYLTVDKGSSSLSPVLDLLTACYMI